MRAPREDFHGWRMVGAAFAVAAFGWGVGFYGTPIYLEAVRDERGWSVSLVSAAATAHFLAGVLVVARLPRLHARFGLPSVTVAGSVLLALGVLGWSLAERPWQLFAATLLSGAGWVTMGPAAVNAILAPWFARRRPAALAMAYNGASVGGVIFAPLLAALVAAAGFTVAAAIVGAVLVAAIAGLAATMLWRTPDALGQRPDGGPADGPAAPRPGLARVARPWRDPAFLTLAGGMACALFAQIGLLSQLVSMLRPALGTQGAGLAAGLATAAAILGRTLAGWLLPAAADRRRAAVASLLVQAAGCAVMAAAGGQGLAWTLLGVVLVGLGLGNATSLPPLVAQAEFAAPDTARVVALIVATAQAAYAFAPAAFGLLREVAPDAAVYAAVAGIQVAAAAVYLGGRGLHLRRGGPEAAGAAS